MGTRDRLFRFTALVAAGSLMLAPILPQPVFAQPAPPPGAAEQQTGGDPPARVGRLALINGTVSYHTADDTQWSAAALNYPVTSGNAFWTEPNAEADIEISASRIALAGGSELDINTLDDAKLQATLPQGEIYIHIRALAPNEVYTVQTPRGTVTIAAPGHYDIVGGDTANPTMVTVIDGAAQVSGPNLSLDVAANQTATITGTDSFAGSVAQAERDAFLTAMLARERPPVAQTIAPPPAVAQMTGAQDLTQYGTWSDAPQYGQVWYPQVAAGWVPYRDGHWAYVPPWGWTWVDDAPWGFAPFHYGRWVEVGGRWGWTPGVATGVYAPVYAPALVTFFGVGVGVGIGAALAAGSIGWAPLGWHEPYRPWYHASNAYLRNVNPHVTNITTITTINRNVTINNFANRAGATIAPASAVAGSRPIQRFAQRPTPQQLAQARPMFGQEPLRPTAGTAGVTPAVARQLHLPPSPAGAPAVAHVGAPGPAITARPVAVTTGGKPPPPPLHNPAAVTAPAAASVHPPAAGPAAQGVVGQPGGAQHLPPLAAPGVHPIPAAPGGAPGPAFTPRTGAAVTGGHPPPTGAPTGPAAVTPGAGAPPAAQGQPPVPTPHVPGPPAGAATPALPQAQHPAVGPPPHVAAPDASVPAAPGAAVVHAPPPPVVHAAPPAPVVHAAPPAPEVHAAPPASVVHAAPPPPPVVHPTPAPEVHAAPPAPVAHIAPPPPVVHPTPPPAPVVHAAPPAPVVHAAPPPAPHPAPAPAPHPASPNEKRPGQQ